jgi:hypothetical protein
LNLATALHLDGWAAKVASIFSGENLKTLMSDPVGFATNTIAGLFDGMKTQGVSAFDQMFSAIGTKFKGFQSFITSSWGNFMTAFISGQGGWARRLVNAAFGFDLIGMIESWTGGHSPERDPREIGRRDEDGDGIYETPVIGVGIEQDEYDRRYGNPEDNYYGTNERPMATGGIVTRPTRALIGEAGPEAVIPLNRAGGFGTTININVSTMDAQSFRDWLRRGGAEIIAQEQPRFLRSVGLA